MGIYFEAILLYVILFFSGSAGAIGLNIAEEVFFSAQAEIYKIILYSIPSLALIWYLLLKGKPAKEWDLKPKKNDIISGLIALPCLLLTSFAISFISGLASEQPVRIALGFPASFSDWAVLSLSCLFAAYLEESFFRYYLLIKRKELNMGNIQAVVFSTLLFSICHLYEGPWGFLNSVISGTILALIFLRYKTIHGIAIAHGLYNIAVYIINLILLRS